MPDDQELEALLTNLESDRVERKESAAEKDKIGQAICAFANDMPDHRQPGLLFIGARDNGKCAGLQITEKLILDISDMQSNGKIHPFPSMTVTRRIIAGCDLLVVEVLPSEMPPVRYDGRTWICVGSRRDKASVEEERRLIERRRYRTLPFDLLPVPIASLDDLDLLRFEREYLPAAVAPEVLQQNGRPIEQKLAGLRLATPEGQPTVAGVLAIGKDPRQFVPGAYVQFLRLEGTELTDPIKDQKEIDGPFLDFFRQIDEVLRINISTDTDIVSAPTEIRHPDYPLAALQQLVRNAVLHRSYEGTNAPVRLYWYSDRIEIHNPGGAYGQVTKANFGAPGVADYRNPHVAESMKLLNWIQRFGAGINIARRELAANGNPPPEFTVEDTRVLVTVWRRR